MTLKHLKIITSSEPRKPVVFSFKRVCLYSKTNDLSQVVFTCLKPTIETPEQCLKSVQI